MILISYDNITYDMIIISCTYSILQQDVILGLEPATLLKPRLSLDMIFT